MQELTDEQANEKVYTHVKLIRAFKCTEGKQKGRLCSKFHCQIPRKASGIQRNGLACESPVTIWGKSTGPFFKHCRRLAEKGCAGHAAVLKELNMLSVRQVQLPSGEFVTVHSFEESFPHHIRFVWLVAGGMSMRMNRNPVFRNYIRGFEPRAVLPHNVTIHRIAAAIDQVQLAQQHTRRMEHIKSYGDLPCISLQLDLYTDTVTGIAYASVHDTYTSIGQDSILKLVDELLEFRAFPFTSHTADDVCTWLVDLLLAFEIKSDNIVGVTPDGEKAGRKGIASVPGLAHKVDVCDQHQVQRTAMYMLGMAGPKNNNPNRDARELLYVNKRVVQLQHQVREVTYGIRDLQIEANIPQSKHLTGVRSHNVRWGNFKNQVTRNNVMRPLLDAVLAKYKREHAGDTALLEAEDLDEYDSSDESTPRGIFTAASKAIERRNIGFDGTSWDPNLELEAMLTKPFEIKEILDKHRFVTRGQE